MMSLKMWILSLICEIANSWRFILFYLILLLGHFITGRFYCRNILLLGYFLQYFFFNHADMSAIEIVYGLFLFVSI